MFCLSQFMFKEGRLSYHINRKRSEKPNDIIIAIQT